MPFHARQLGERLRSMNVGTVTITKRGSAVDVDELSRKWRLTGVESPDRDPDPGSGQAVCADRTSGTVTVPSRLIDFPLRPNEYDTH